MFEFATLLVATVWCVWHGRHLLAGVFVAAAVTVNTFALSFLFTALWKYTRGSVLVVAMAHAAHNAAILFPGNTVANVPSSRG